MDATRPDAETLADEVDRLVEQHRIASLWFLRPDYRPTTTAERIRVLRWIEQRGDLESFRKAATLRRWLTDCATHLPTPRRTASSASYTRGAALNEAMASGRLRDIDLFHDTTEALEASWAADRALLETNGYAVHVLRERGGLVEAEVEDGADRARLEWTRDSAFRFFPLQQHAELGLTLHPFDLATNKVLALVGRLEVRDWVDVIASDERFSRSGAWPRPARTRLVPSPSWSGWQGRPLPAVEVAQPDQGDARRRA
jgi:hypothetical protein